MTEPALIEILDAAAAAATPATETVDVGGWVVRRTEGLSSKRTNSVWPRGHDGTELATMLDAVERFYAAHELPACFQLSPAVHPAELDAILADRGYSAIGPTEVHACRLAGIPTTPASDLRTVIEPMPGADWWATWRPAIALDPGRLRPVAEMLERVPGEVAAATVSLDGAPAGVGLAVRDGHWIGIFNMATLPAARRRGVGRAALEALAAWGRERGATSAYLQVDADNAAAQSLYRSAGFAPAYAYRYRVSHVGAG